MSVGKQHEIRVSSDNQSIVISNVLVGDVWIAAGQSNMEFPLLFDIRGIEEAKNTFNPNIRLYTCKRFTIPEKEKVVWAFERVEENPKWNICDENSALHFCAIGNYVAKLLNKELDIPIGVISANRSATKIESYIPECEFESEELSSYMVNFNNTKIPDDEADKLFDEYYEKDLVWMNNDGVTMEELVREIGVEPAVVKGIWRPRPAMTQMYKYSPNAPGILYKRFIEEQIAPMAVKGVLWYQGESNRGSENYTDTQNKGSASRCTNTELTDFCIGATTFITMNFRITKSIRSLTLAADILTWNLAETVTLYILLRTELHWSH